jgi:hypothetical protein
MKANMRRLLMALLAMATALACAACTGGDPATPDVPDDESSTVTLYLPNDNADGFTTKDAMTDGTAEDIVRLLVAEGALPAGTELISCQVTGSSGLVDMNAAYGQAITNSGTAGEYMRVGCLVNTLLVYYGLDEIRLTVEGETPVSGHTVYDQPLHFYEDF